MQLLVSPNTNKASGRISSKILSEAIITLPIVSAELDPATSKK